MVALTNVLAQQSSDGGTLLGIAAIITATGTLLAVLVSYFRKGKGDDDSGDLASDAKERIRFLKDTIAEMERSLERCRARDQLITAEGRLKDMHIGTLEAQLADARRDLEEARRDLAECQRKRAK